MIYDGRSNSLIPRDFLSSDWLHFVDSNIQEKNIYYNSILVLKIKTINSIIEPTILDFNIYLCNYISNINVYYTSFNINKFITDYTRINYNKNNNKLYI